MHDAVKDDDELETVYGEIVAAMVRELGITDATAVPLLAKAIRKVRSRKIKTMPPPG